MKRCVLAACWLMAMGGVALPTGTARALEVFGVTDLAPASSTITLNPGGSDSGLGALSNSGVLEQTLQGSTARLETEGTTIVGSSPTAIARVQANITEFGAPRIFGLNARAELSYQIAVRPYEIGGGDQFGFELPITLFGSASVDELGFAEGSPYGSRANGDITIVPAAGGGLVYNYSTAESIPEFARNGSLQNFTGEFWFTPGITYALLINAFADAVINSAQGTNGFNSATSEAIVDPIFAFDQARYDARRATDPMLPEIQLDEVFFLAISENVLDALPGDFDDSGLVEQADLNLVLTNWGLDAPFEPNGEPFATDTVDQEELNRVLTNWGSSTAPSFEGFEVPEPVSALALLLCGWRRRHGL